MAFSSLFFEFVYTPKADDFPFGGYNCGDTRPKPVSPWVEKWLGQIVKKTLESASS